MSNRVTESDEMQIKMDPAKALELQRALRSWNGRSLKLSITMPAGEKQSAPIQSAEELFGAIGFLARHLDEKQSMHVKIDKEPANKFEDPKIALDMSVHRDGMTLLCQKVFIGAPSGMR